MIAKRVGQFFRVRDVLSIFQQMGCDIRVAEADLHDEDGNVFNCRYIVNPTTNAFVAIQDIGDDELVSATEVAYWQRRTGITIPLPPAP